MQINSTENSRSVCIIPARGGSKRIPRKNLKTFCGKPIIEYAISNALKSDIFDRVIVSTDDEEIAAVSKSFGAEVPFMRSKKTSDDFATTLDVLKEVVNKLKSKTIENICCLYPCTPLVSKENLKKAYNKFVLEGFETLLSIQEYPHPIQRSLSFNEQQEVVFNDATHISTRTQDLETFYHDAGQFYFHKKKVITDYDNIYSGRTGGYLLSSYQAQDIDNSDDWALAESKFKFSNKNM